MKEYMVQERRNGKWIPARYPNVGSSKTITSGHDARAQMDDIKKAWDQYKERLSDIHGPVILKRCASMIPDEFRIVSREVTEWEVESNGV